MLNYIAQKDMENFDDKLPLNGLNPGVTCNGVVWAEVIIVATTDTIQTFHPWH